MKYATFACAALICISCSNDESVSEPTADRAEHAAPTGDPEGEPVEAETAEPEAAAAPSAEQENAETADNGEGNSEENDQVDEAVEPARPVRAWESWATIDVMTPDVPPRAPNTETRALPSWHSARQPPFRTREHSLLISCAPYRDGQTYVRRARAHEDLPEGVDVDVRMADGSERSMRKPRSGRRSGEIWEQPTGDQERALVRPLIRVENRIVREPVFRELLRCPRTRQPCIVFGSADFVNAMEEAPPPPWGIVAQALKFEARSSDFATEDLPENVALEISERRPCRYARFRAPGTGRARNAMLLPTREGVEPLFVAQPMLIGFFGMGIEPLSKTRDTYYTTGSNVVAGRFVFTEDSEVDPATLAIVFVAHNGASPTIVKVGTKQALVFPGGSAYGREATLAREYQPELGRVFVWSRAAELVLPGSPDVHPNAPGGSGD